MSLLKKVKDHFKFKAVVPELKDYIGKKVQIQGIKEPVVIEHICGNVGMTLGRGAENIRPQYYEINGTHLISMLRFHAQMTGATDITEEQFQAFEAMEFHAERRDKDDGKPVDIEPIFNKKEEKIN